MKQEKHWKLAYLCTQLHQEFCSARSVWCQTPHCSAQIGQARDRLVGLAVPTSWAFWGACHGWRAGGEASSPCCGQAHQSNQCSDICKPQRFKTSSQATTGTTSRKRKYISGIKKKDFLKWSFRTPHITLSTNNQKKTQAAISLVMHTLRDSQKYYVSWKLLNF